MVISREAPNECQDKTRQQNKTKTKQNKTKKRKQNKTEYQGEP